MRRLFFRMTALLSFLMFVSCADIFTPRGTDSFVVQLGSSSRSVWNASDIDHYVIEFYKADSEQPFITRQGLPGTTVFSGPLDASQYSIKGYAYLFSDNNSDYIFAEGSVTATAIAGITTTVPLMLEINPDLSEKEVTFSNIVHSDSFTVKEPAAGQDAESASVNFNLHVDVPYKKADARLFYTTGEPDADGSFDDSAMESLIEEFQNKPADGTINWAEDMDWLSKSLVQISSDVELKKGLNNINFTADVEYPATRISAYIVVCTEEAPQVTLWKSSKINISGTAVKNTTTSPSGNRYSQWSELKTAVESYTGTEPETFIIYGSCSADETISVKGNVLIYPDADVVIDRKTGENPFTDGALFQVEQGASLTLGGNESHKLELHGRCGEIVLHEGETTYSATCLTSTAPLIYSYGNLTISDNCFLLNNFNSTSADETMGGAIHTQVKETGDSVSLTLKKCTIKNCYSGKNGGGVYAKGRYTPSGTTGVEGTYSRIDFVMDNAEIVDNRCTTNGGGLFIATINGEIKNDSYVRLNIAGINSETSKGLGGGIYLSGSNKPVSSTLTVSSDSYITENHAYSNGGGIYQNSYTTLTVESPDESLKDNTLGNSNTANGTKLFINTTTIYNNETYSTVQKIN